MRWPASVLAVVAALAAAGPANAADPVTDLRTGVTRLQQVQPAVRQAITGLQGVPARWDRLTSEWQRFVQDLEKAGGAVDPNALVQTILRESYIQTTEDLRFYAEKVKYFNAVKKQVREYLQSLRDAEARLKAAARTAPDLRLAALEQAVSRLDARTPGLGQIEKRLKRRAARFEALSPRDPSIIAILIGLLRESIKELNEDKKYFLQQLQQANKTAAALADELARLVAASEELARKEKKP